MHLQGFLLGNAKDVVKLMNLEGLVWPDVLPIDIVSNSASVPPRTGQLISAYLTLFVL